MSDMAAQDLVVMLRRHYLPEGRPAGGVLAVEIGSPDGGRRADALWAPVTYTGGSGLVGHEVKVSRADVMAELADPTKSEPWAKYCTQWWLTVSDPALVEGLDIPQQWGLMSPPSGRRTRTMTVLRKAPTLKPGDTSEAWRRVMVWRLNHDLDDLRTARRELEFSDRTVESLRKQINESEARAWAREDPNSARVREVLAAVREMTNLHGRNPAVPWIFADNIPVEDVASAIVDAASVRRVTEQLTKDLAYLIKDARDAVKPMDRAAAALEAIEGVSA